MKRQLKFRAWDNLDKSMYQIRIIDFLANAEINSIRLVVPVPTMPDGDIDFDFPIRRDGEYELMQFTGLLDKNGKEIYESDIVSYTNPYSNKGYTHVVKYDPMWAAFGLFEKMEDEWCKENDWVKLISIEVIGNIYSNPELLKS